MQPSTNQSSPIRIAVAGAAGKMGREAVAALQADARFELAAVLVRDAARVDTQLSIPVFEDADALLRDTQRLDVWLDLTDATSVVHNADAALSAEVRPVLGATGYTPQDILRWQKTCAREGLGGLAAPNFAIGALLMTRFAAEAARFYASAEIVELHHDGKRDAPSGTARRTAEAIADARAASSASGLAAAAAPTAATRSSADVEAVDHSTGQARTSTSQHSAPSDRASARGILVNDTAIHSVRLPGLVAHQEVLFGGTGEVLTLRHDSMSRTSFMPGILFSCAKVMELRQFVYGLEHLLW